MILKFTNFDEIILLNKFKHYSYFHFDDFNLNLYFRMFQSIPEKWQKIQMKNKCPDKITALQGVTWWLTETRRWEWYSPPVELKLSSSQKVTVRNECGSHRCLHLSDLGSPDIGRGRRKWSQMIGGGTPNESGVPFPSTEVNTKKGSFWATLVADGR